MMAANTTHPVVAARQPDDKSIKVWRYIDLPKLLDFLQTGNLHFAQVATLGDPHEGTLSLGSVLDQERYPLRKIGEFEHKLQQEGAYVNCWHASAMESAAMWRLYATGSGSVVLQSTYRKLEEAVPDQAAGHFDLCIGMVDYLNYENPNVRMYERNSEWTPYMCKRQEFSHESEVRCLVLGEPGLSPVEVGVDISDLVETIRIQPSAPAWVRKAIRALIGKYLDRRVRVEESDIGIRPRLYTNVATEGPHLSGFGERVAEYFEAQFWATDCAETLLPNIAEVNPLEIEDYSKSVVRDMHDGDPEFERRVDACVDEFDVQATDVLLMLSIVLRDELLARQR